MGSPRKGVATAQRSRLPNFQRTVSKKLPERNRFGTSGEVSPEGKTRFYRGRFRPPNTFHLGFSVSAGSRGALSGDFRQPLRMSGGSYLHYLRRQKKRVPLFPMFCRAPQVISHKHVTPHGRFSNLLDVLDSVLQPRFSCPSDALSPRSFSSERRLS